MKRGELAKRTGCNIETIRYYEKVGLLPDPPRTEKGHRLYGENHERTLHFILRSRELGFPIEEVKGLLSLVHQKNVTCGEVRTKTVQHLKLVRARIDDLQKMERSLVQTVAECEGGNSPDCPIIDALFRD